MKILTKFVSLPSATPHVSNAESHTETANRSELSLYPQIGTRDYAEGLTSMDEFISYM
jgi:hypothetical protein